MKADDSYIEPDSGDLARLLATVRQITATASARILSVYETDFAVEHKDDRSPLTEADMQAHRAIISGLRELTPGWPILSEESASVDFSERQTWQCYWLVDPLDGTREFVKRNGEFTVNIALIADHQPILGVVQVPVTGVCYFAARGVGAYKFVPEYGEIRINTRSADASRLAIAGSRSHGSERFQTFMEKLDGAEVVTIGSSLKSCLVAEGLIDLYPRFGLTSEWDTAAAHCVVEQAGGEITDMAFQPLRYNCKDSLLNPNFLVIGDPAFDWRSYLPVE